jgi:hypothetical protein
MQSASPTSVNAPPSVVTDTVFQLPMFWLNADAE